MRALEYTIWTIFIICSPALLQTMGMIHDTDNTCTTLGCQTSAFLYNMTSTNSLSEVSLDTTDPGSLLWTSITIGLNFIVFALFWALYLLSIIIIAWPALISMFSINSTLAAFMFVGIWLIWIIGIVQIKRGGLGFDTWR